MASGHPLEYLYFVFGLFGIIILLLRLKRCRIPSTYHSLLSLLLLTVSASNRDYRYPLAPPRPQHIASCLSLLLDTHILLRTVRKLGRVGSFHILKKSVFVSHPPAHTHPVLHFWFPAASERHEGPARRKIFSTGFFNSEYKLSSILKSTRRINPKGKHCIGYLLVPHSSLVVGLSLFGLL
ncbi:hypothetical protein F5Y04DRAFT_57718 [Hypomontagnella monticulosa]|nr:hypothetical protein F5Y04DRAFT_57718 [Hypomontagnella monticulosa]